MISYHPADWQGRDMGSFYEGFRVLGPSERISKIITKNIWSPILWERGRRASRNFRFSSFVALDFDGGVSLDDAINNIFCDLIHIIAPTRSHRMDKNGVVDDRFRVLVKLSTDTTDCARFTATARHYAKLYEADIACTDCARAFYPSLHIASMSTEGYTWDLVEADDIETKEEFLHRKATAPLSNDARIVLEHGVADNRNQTCFRVALELLRKGYTKEEAYKKVFRYVPTTHDFKESEKRKIIESAHAQKLKAPAWCR